jgi:hypothetical protein
MHRIGRGRSDASASYRVSGGICQLTALQRLSAWRVVYAGWRESCMLQGKLPPTVDLSHDRESRQVEALSRFPERNNC